MRLNNEIVSDGLIYYLNPYNKKSYTDTDREITGNSTITTQTSPNSGKYFWCDGGYIATDNDLMDLLNVPVGGSRVDIPYSIEAWVYIESVPSGIGLDGASIVGHASSSGIGLQIHNFGGSAVANFGYRSNNNYNGSAIPTKTWYHIVGTRSSGGNINIYYNGTSVFSGAGDLSVNYTTVDVEVGRANNRIGILDGRIGSVRIYNKELSSDDVKQNYQAELGRYNLLTFRGTYKFRQVIHFDSENTSIDITSNAIPTQPTYAVSAWVYLESYGQILLSDGASGSTNTMEFLTSTTFKVSQQDFAFTTNPIPLKQWIHLVVLRDGANSGRVFVNGLESDTGSLSVLTGFDFNRISGDEDTKFMKYSRLGSLAIWLDSITEVEIERLWDEGRGNDPRMVTSPLPKYYYDFNGLERLDVLRDTLGSTVGTMSNFYIPQSWTPYQDSYVSDPDFTTMSFGTDRFQITDDTRDSGSLGNRYGAINSTVDPRNIIYAYRTTSTVYIYLGSLTTDGRGNILRQNSEVLLSSSGASSFLAKVNNTGRYIIVFRKNSVGGHVYARLFDYDDITNTVTLVGSETVLYSGVTNNTVTDVQYVKDNLLVATSNRGATNATLMRIEVNGTTITGSANVYSIQISAGFSATKLMITSPNNGFLITQRRPTGSGNNRYIEYASFIDLNSSSVSYGTLTNTTFLETSNSSQSIRSSGCKYLDNNYALISYSENTSGDGRHHVALVEVSGTTLVFNSEISSATDTENNIAESVHDIEIITTYGDTIYFFSKTGARIAILGKVNIQQGIITKISESINFGPGDDFYGNGTMVPFTNITGGYGGVILSNFNTNYVTFTYSIS